MKFFQVIMFMMIIVCFPNVNIAQQVFETRFDNLIQSDGAINAGSVNAAALFLHKNPSAFISLDQSVKRTLMVERDRLEKTIALLQTGWVMGSALLFGHLFFAAFLFEQNGIAENLACLPLIGGMITFGFVVSLQKRFQNIIMILSKDRSGI